MIFPAINFHFVRTFAAFLGIAIIHPPRFFGGEFVHSKRPAHAAQWAALWQWRGEEPWMWWILFPNPEKKMRIFKHLPNFWKNIETSNISNIYIFGKSDQIHQYPATSKKMCLAALIKSVPLVTQWHPSPHLPRMEVPLWCAVAASNELPESDELDALFDRCPISACPDRWPTGFHHRFCRFFRWTPFFMGKLTINGDFQ